MEAAVPKFTVGTSQEELLAVTALLADQPNIQRTKSEGLAAAVVPGSPLALQKYLPCSMDLGPGYWDLFRDLLRACRSKGAGLQWI